MKCKVCDGAFGRWEYFTGRPVWKDCTHCGASGKEPRDFWADKPRSK